MTDSVFLMDGKAYNVEVEADSLERSFAVTDTDQSGRTLDYTMERDVIGTFYNYAMKVYPKDGDTASYDAYGCCPLLSTLVSHLSLIHI